MGKPIQLPVVEVPGVEIREARLKDVAYIAKRLRQEDIDELNALYPDGDPVKMTVASFQHSEEGLCWVVVRDNKPTMVFGVREGGTPGIGYIWMLSTNGIKRMEKPFIRYSKEIVAALQDRYPILTNFIWKGNDLHIRWLRWMGFSFFPTDNSENFWTFARLRKCAFQQSRRR